MTLTNIICSLEIRLETFRQKVQFFERAFDSRLCSRICVIVGYSYKTLELEMEYLFGRESQYFDFVGIKSEKRNHYKYS